MATTNTRRKGSQAAAKADPAPETTDAPDAPDTAVEGDLYARLADGAKQRQEMPKAPTRRRSTIAPLAELIARSYAENQVFELPGIPATDQAINRLSGALRRAATSKELGVSISHEVDGNEAVFFIQGRDKRTRA